MTTPKPIIRKFEPHVAITGVTTIWAFFNPLGKTPPPSSNIKWWGPFTLDGHGVGGGGTWGTTKLPESGWTSAQWLGLGYTHYAPGDQPCPDRAPCKSDDYEFELSDSDAALALDIQKHAQDYSEPYTNRWTGYQILLAAREGLFRGRELQKKDGSAGLNNLRDENAKLKTQIENLKKDNVYQAGVIQKLDSQLATVRDALTAEKKMNADNCRLLNEQQAQLTQSRELQLRLKQFVS